MSVKLVSIEDDGVAQLACGDDLSGLEMLDNNMGLSELLGKDWANRRVVLDLGAPQFIDSAAIGWLLSLHKAFDREGGRLVIYNPNPSVRRVINLLRIDEVLNLASDQERALQCARG